MWTTNHGQLKRRPAIYLPDIPRNGLTECPSISIERHLIGLIGHLSVSCVTYTFVQDKNTGETQTKHPCPKWVRNREIICRGSETELATVNEELLIWYCRNSASSCNITYVVQQDTQLLLWLNIYSQYV